MPFQRLIALSAALHVVVFGTALAFAHYGEDLWGRAPGVITVALVGDGGKASPSGQERSARATSVAAPAAPAMPDLRAAEVPAPSPEQGPVDTVGDAVGRGAGEPSGSAGDRHGADAGSGSENPGGPAGILSSEQWRMLQSAIERAKSYPRLARERGIEGTVLVRFRVLPTGEVEEVNVARSSGAAILDEASVRTVRRAGPMPYVNGWIEVPMVYELK